MTNQQQILLDEIKTLAVEKIGELKALVEGVEGEDARVALNEKIAELETPLSEKITNLETCLKQA